MIAMCMRDHRAVHRFPRIDVETSRFTEQPTLGLGDQVRHEESYGGVKATGDLRFSIDDYDSLIRQDKAHESERKNRVRFVNRQPLFISVHLWLLQTITASSSLVHCPAIRRPGSRTLAS
jgi:hypothetical protein